MKWLAVVGTREVNDAIRRDVESLVNQKIVDLADELAAFRVNNSRGTTFTIDQARKKDITVKVFDYSITSL